MSFHRPSSHLILAFAAFALLLPVPVAAQPSLTGLGTVDGSPFDARGVSDNGRVVVGGRVGDPGPPGRRSTPIDGAVHWTPETGAETVFSDIYDSNSDYWETEGNVFSQVSGDGTGYTRYFEADPYSHNNLYRPDGAGHANDGMEGTSPATGISADGTAFVSFGIEGPFNPARISRIGPGWTEIQPAAYDPGGTPWLSVDPVVPTGNDGALTKIVGSFHPRTGPGAGGRYSFLWTEAAGSSHFLPDEDTWSLALSENGDYIAGAIATPSGDQLFRWTERGGVDLLGSLGAAGASSPMRVTDDGEMIGFGERVWLEGQGFVDLEHLVGSMMGFDLSEWQSLGELRDMAPDGNVLLGYGTKAAGLPESWLVVVPEPGTGVLVALGCVLLSIRRRADTR